MTEPVQIETAEAEVLVQTDNRERDVDPEQTVSQDPELNYTADEA